MQSRTATNIIQDIQKLNVDDVFTPQLNEYINERDNLRQRKANLNTLRNDYNNNLNQYNNLHSSFK